MESKAPVFPEENVIKAADEVLARYENEHPEKLPASSPVHIRSSDAVHPPCSNFNAFPERSSPDGGEDSNVEILKPKSDSVNGSWSDWDSIDSSDTEAEKKSTLLSLSKTDFESGDDVSRTLKYVPPKQRSPLKLSSSGTQKKLSETDDASAILQAFKRQNLGDELDIFASFKPTVVKEVDLFEDMQPAIAKSSRPSLMVLDKKDGVASSGMFAVVVENSDQVGLSFSA